MAIAEAAKWAAPARGNINAQAPERPSAHHGAPPAVNHRRARKS